MNAKKDGVYLPIGNIEEDIINRDFSIAINKDAALPLPRCCSEENSKKIPSLYAICPIT